LGVRYNRYRSRERISL